MTGLLPCPFCGGEPEIVEHARDAIFGTGDARVRCTGCGVSTQVYREYARDEIGSALELATTNWNMRRPSPAASDDNEVQR